MTQEIERAGFSPAFTPAVIECDFDGMRARLAEMIEPYSGLDERALSTLDVKEAKRCRADLNRIIKSVEDGRKAVKRAYNDPLKAFEEEVREVLAPAIEARDAIDAHVKGIEDAERAKLREGLANSYYDYAPALVEAVPFERIVEPQWLNKSFGAVKACEAMYAKVDAIAGDWDALKKLDLPCYAEAEREFFRTLSLQSAIDRANACEAERESIEAVRRQVDANREAQGTAKDEARAPYRIDIDLTEGERARLLAFIKGNEIGANRRIGRRA